MSKSICPKCKSEIEDKKCFWWGLDIYGYPTIENMTCDKCGASTKPYDRRKKKWGFDDFKEVTP